MSYIVRGIDIENLLKAQKKFEMFRCHLGAEQEKAGASQAFEFCYELGWKTMKRMLSVLGVDAVSPKQCIREAALNNLISDPEQWFIFVDMRNAASQTYDEQNMEEVIEQFELFSVALNEFVYNIKKLA